MLRGLRAENNSVKDKKLAASKMFNFSIGIVQEQQILLRKRDSAKHRLIEVSKAALDFAVKTLTINITRFYC
jgi:hypothetical protein